MKFYQFHIIFRPFNKRLSKFVCGFGRNTSVTYDSAYYLDEQHCYDDMVSKALAPESVEMCSEFQFNTDYVVFEAAQHYIDSIYFDDVTIDKLSKDDLLVDFVF